MNPFDPETWKQQWTAFWSAPFIMLPLIVVAGLTAWWFRGKMSDAEIAGLKEQISVKEERLKFAFDLVAASDRDFEKLQKDFGKLQKEFQDYKEQVAIEGRNASPAKVDAAIVRVASGNAEIRSKLFNALMSREVDRRTPIIKIDGDPMIR
jgi:hypothetical protein